ncbi:macrolide ABC transporter ATP-binding protein [Candidatus Uhrbacteria bacterium RIFCSPHIGHO2_02_FULL_60_44]|nr:MAG: macrolide ABC transporter ATP-binding protein [Candidatus Uhrbacteria bacterium RIFCSPHIGHO2_02_FULL_60_44]
MPDLIVANNLTKQYVNEDVVTPVLHGISFSIPKGQFVAIMGPSGSGKSTLMNILGFLDVPSGGSYEFAGKDVSKLDDDRLAEMRGKNVGFIFQTFNLLPKTTVLDNVKLPLLYSDVPVSKRDAMAKEAIEAVGLAHRTNNLSNQLSGGERQRVAIARALIRRPDVILADEPTGNLDSKSGQQVMDILQTLNEKNGHTVILVTHETYTAEYAERVLRLRDGLLQADERIEKRRKVGEFIK